MYTLKGRQLLTAVTVLTSLGFMLIGYDNGLMGGFAYTPPFENTFGIDKYSWNGQLIGFIVSMYEIGAFVGAVTSSFFGDKLGRKKSVLLGVCVMIVGAILQASSYQVAQMLVGRFVSGFGLGVVNSTVPVMQAEFAPSAKRGLFVCMQISTLNFGIMLVYWICYGFNLNAQPYGTSYVWRVPTILQVVFLLAMVLITLFLPETPRWLAARDRNEEALQVLEDLYHGRMSQEEIQEMHGIIVGSVSFETSQNSGGWGELLKSDVIHTRRRFLIACGIQIFQQLGGINALIYYAQFIFSNSLGFSDHTASLLSGLLNTWFFVASFIPWLLIDRLGRRKLLLGSIFVMASVMVVQTALVYQIQYKTAIAYSAGIGACAMLFVFQGAFTIGFQATVWVYPSEILPLKIRQKGSSISTACNWIMNFLIVYITPVMANNIGYRMYILFAVLNFVWLPIIFFFFPETKGLLLEDVDRLFCNDARLPHVEAGDKTAIEHLEKTASPRPSVEQV